MKKIMVINGPNLNMLGIREPEVYGGASLSEINEQIKESISKNTMLKEAVELEFFQSNHEGAIIDKIHDCYDKKDGIVINPGAFTHYSYAIRDAISSVVIPTIEVHLSDIYNREKFREISVTKDVCLKQISGKGIGSYIEAIESLVNN